MGFIIEVILWFFVEVVFWGIMYWTGWAIAKIVTTGRWKTDGISPDKEEWKEKRRQDPFIIVAVLGAMFWFSVTLIIALILISPGTN